MPLYEFGKNDILYNQIKAHPSSSFFIYDSKVYYNNRAADTGSMTFRSTGADPYHDVNVDHNVPTKTGFVSLLELNIDRGEYKQDGTPAARHIGPATGSDGVLDTGLIYPWVYKGTHKVAFRSISRNDFLFDYEQGDVITGSYRMSSSISRERHTVAQQFNDGPNFTGSALKNSLDYAKRLGDHYDFPSGSSLATNMIQIPSIFYGSGIKKGTVDLKYYMTGTLVGRLRDTRQDGALIQSSGTEGSGHDGEVAGAVLYKEGFILLTGSWNLATVFGEGGGLSDKDYLGNAISAANASWLNFGFGCNDKVTSTTSLGNASASFSIDFAGTHKIPTVTMMAHANKGELNHSNNPTYISASQTDIYTALTGNNIYRERPLVIKNIHSSSYASPTGSLVKTTYITKIGIYDEKKKLIGVASLAKPVKKTEDRDLTFKLKLDI